MFRRSAIEAIGGIADAITIIPDYYLYTAIAHRFPAAAVQEVVCRYRMHDSNTSHTTAISVHQEALRLMDMWQNEVEPSVLAKCKRHHSTQIALAEMRTPGTFLPGISAAGDGRIRCVANSASFFLRVSSRSAEHRAAVLEAN